MSRDIDTGDLDEALSRLPFGYDIVKSDTPRRSTELRKSVTSHEPADMPASAISERERLVAAYIHANPAESRANAVNAVYTSNPGLYERCRREETVDSHGRTLAESYGHAAASFGVNQQGETITKSDLLDAVIMGRAVTHLSKSASGTTLEQAMSAVFAGDPSLYARWREATR